MEYNSLIAVTKKQMFSIYDRTSGGSMMKPNDYVPVINYLCSILNCEPTIQLKVWNTKLTEQHTLTDHK
jgi:hypothetical protein